MAGSISGLHGRVNRELERCLSAEQIENEARRCGHRWRKGKLGPAQTIRLLLLQLLALNSALVAVRHLAGVQVTAGALCQARARLPLALLRRCCAVVSAGMAQQIKRFDWCGREVLGVDAVCYYTPDTPGLRRWLGSKNRFGFPLMKVVSLLSLSSGVMLHQIALPHRRGEAPLLGRLLRRIAPGAVLVMDRAFASFANLHAITRAGADALIRIKTNCLAKNGTSRQVLRRLGKKDHLVRWQRPGNRCALLSRRRWNALPDALLLREVSFTVRRRGYRSRAICLITTLLDPALYPASKLAQLYHRRWEIEIQFRHLKTTLKWEFLRCKSIAGVKKELLLRQIAYNLLRRIIAAAAQKQALPIGRISFADALCCLLYASARGEPTPLLRVPHRPWRTEPRRLKRQDKNYLPLTCPRAQATRKAA